MSNVEAKKMLSVSSEINAPIGKVWNAWVNPRHITQWNFASEDWCCPKSENIPMAGEKFTTRMEAKDGSFGFDFWGTYNAIIPNKEIKTTIGDGRIWNTVFEEKNGIVLVTEYFEAENENPHEMQVQGWQMILNNFKKYVENNHVLTRLFFEIEINRTAEIVYQNMLHSKYKEWVSVFNPTSDKIGNWEKNTEMQFIGIDEAGKTGGIASTIEENFPNKFVSIAHKGIIKNGETFFSGEEVEPWIGANEIYCFNSNSNGTHLQVYMDTIDDYADYFIGTYPTALQKLKEICEA